MEPKKGDYETTFIVNASLDDPQVDAIITKVQEQITRYGGEVTSVNKWGRKRLAYAIKNKNTGFYTHIEFIAAGSSIQQLERFYKLDENIIRFLTIQLDKKAMKAKLQPKNTETINEHRDVLDGESKEPLFESDNPAI